MNKLLKNTLLIWEMLFPALLCAAEFQVSFEKFPYMSELPSSAVRRIFQDSEGYLWFGTADGVCRYDGYEVKTFRSDMNNPSLLTHNDIQCIAEDFEGCLWIGTRLGISLLDKKTMTVSAFREAALDGDVINALVCDNSGDMWIAASRGLFRYDITQKTLRTYWSNPSDKKTIPSNSVTNIYKSNDGTIWLMFWNGGLCRYLAEYDNFERFPNSGGVNNPFRLYQDRSGHYWLCTWGDGFYRFDPSAPEGKMYEKVPMLNTVTGKEENTFFSIVQDDKYGYLWVMSLNELFVLKETEDGSLESIDISSQLKSFSKLFSEIIKDRDDNLWIAAFGDGPIMLKFDRPSVRNYAMEMLQAKMGSSFSVIGMQNDSDNCMWLSINRYGLCLYDLKNHRLTTQYDMDIKDLPYLGTAHTIMERKNHAEYWVCTENKYIYIFKKKAAGIYLFDTIDLSSVPNLNYGTRKVLFEDKEGAVWIGLQSGSLLRVSSNTPPPCA